eukprot:TRINITY_DN18730_c0_g1_i1.p1 TRINITY_DN18730_c0_g1~~TRINITY_DN18730_c0_g1_i1.p1  ORF type:complete len:482 (+),score=9.86 TRINITY_DN18730_c0_g1_i1:138-1583(+)
MFHFRYLLLLLIFANIFVIDSKQTNGKSFNKRAMKTFIELARNARFNRSNDYNTNMKQQSYIYHQIWTQLPFYGGDINITEPLDAFLSNYFGNEAQKYDLVKIPNLSVAGISDEMVFRIKNKSTQKTSFIIKVFYWDKHNNTKFIPELSSLDFLKNQHFKNVTTIRPLAAGKTHVNSRDYVLLLESVAKGTQFGDLLNKLTSEKNKTANNTHLMLIFKKGLEALGKGLGEFHLKQSKEPGHLSTFEIVKLRETVNKVVHGNKKQLIERFINLTEVQSYVNSMIAEVKKRPVYHSFRHGDCNLNNVFFSDKTNKITFIDLAGLHTSFDINMEPSNKDGMKDFCELQFHMEHKLTGYMKHRQKQSLFDIFRNNYILMKGNSFDPLIEHFYQTRYMLGWLHVFGGYENRNVSDFAKRRHQTFFQSAVKFFQVAMMKNASINHTFSTSTIQIPQTWKKTTQFLRIVLLWAFLIIGGILIFVLIKR